MKRRIGLAVTFLLLSTVSEAMNHAMKALLRLGSIAFAGVFLSVPAIAGVEDIVSSNNQIGVQLIDTHVDYTETYSTVGTLDTERGSVPGFGLSVSAMQDLIFGKDYVEAQFSQTKGDTSYLGSIGAPTTAAMVPLGLYGTVSTTHNTKLTDFNLRYGKGFDISGQVLLTPFLEFGHHEWNRNFSLCSVGLAICTYSEDYKNYYYGIGTLVQIEPMNRTVVTVSALLGRTLSPALSGSLGGGSLSFGSQGLGPESLYRFGLSADYEFIKSFHANFGVDYTSFKYGQSALFALVQGVTPNIFEPDSKTNYITVKLGLGYSF